MAILSVGKKVPRCSLVDDQGVTHEVRSLARRWLVLYFYPKDLTPGCTQEACEFTAGGADFDALEAAVVGVSPDSVKSHASFIAKEKLGFRLLSDPPAASGVPVAAGLFGVWGTKSMYGREYQGVLRTTFLIDAEGNVRRVWEKVKVAGHAAEVLATIRELSGDAPRAAASDKATSRPSKKATSKPTPKPTLKPARKAAATSAKKAAARKPTSKPTSKPVSKSTSRSGATGSKRA